MHLIRRTALAIATLTFASLTHAWGAEGHRLIAELAEAQLTPAARSHVARILEQEPGATLSSVSTWADEIRTRDTAAWHYVNLPESGCSYESARDCAGGDCIVEAINAQVDILNSSAIESERLTALKWVVHLVGDIHQPLHAGLKSDKGGTLYQVQAFGRGMNLHSLWDSGLIRNRAGAIDALRTAASTPGTATPRIAQPSAWAVESCKVVQTPGYYPDGRFIDDAYADKWDPVLISRIKLAGRRKCPANPS
jgi:nuclease S1